MSKKRLLSISVKHQIYPSRRRKGSSRALIRILVGSLLAPVSSHLTPTSGISALCLSGGASLGYCKLRSITHAAWPHLFVDHYGVVRALLDAGVLPRVISGTSAGGLIAALTAVYTEEELKEILIPEIADRLNACDEPFSVWTKRFWETGARFNSNE